MSADCKDSSISIPVSFFIASLPQPSSVFTLKIPDTIEVIEAVTENISSSYRSNGKLIVTDGRNLVYFPPDGKNNVSNEALMAKIML
jgi:hypothetical protein